MIALNVTIRLMPFTFSFTHNHTFHSLSVDFRLCGILYLFHLVNGLNRVNEQEKKHRKGFNFTQSLVIQCWHTEVVYKLGNFVIHRVCMNILLVLVLVLEIALGCGMWFFYFLFHCVFFWINTSKILSPNSKSQDEFYRFFFRCSCLVWINLFGAFCLFGQLKISMNISLVKQKWYFHKNHAADNCDFTFFCVSFFSFAFCFHFK